jgi:regulatory protein
MKKITAIEVQRRTPNRVNIHLDGEFAFGLARIVAAWLKVGEELSEEKIEQLQAEDARERAFPAGNAFSELPRPVRIRNPAEPSQA